MRNLRQKGAGIESGSAGQRASFGSGVKALPDRDGAPFEVIAAERRPAAPDWRER
jgi:hypothetical protein